MEPTERPAIPMPVEWLVALGLVVLWIPLRFYNVSPLSILVESPGAHLTALGGITVLMTLPAIVGLVHRRRWGLWHAGVIAVLELIVDIGFGAATGDAWSIVVIGYPLIVAIACGAILVRAIRSGPEETKELSREQNRRAFWLAFATVVATFGVAAAIVIYFVTRALAYPDEAHLGDGKEVEVEIVSGMSFPSIASTLEQRGVLDKPTWFRLFAMWKGKTADVKTGKYLVKDNLTPRALLEILVKGVKEVTVKVTFPEGEHMLDFFRRLEEAKVAPAKELEALARDKAFLGKHAITGETVEGYLFPDTYQFRLHDKAQNVLVRLITRHQEVWNELIAKHATKREKLKEKLGWSDRDILIMASIVEKEAVEPKERPTIAQVFMNRLSSQSFRPHRLETDPTIRYGCTVPAQRSLACTAWHEPCLKAGKPMGCDRLHRAQLDDKDNPYNTYQHELLPPGPIANPGRASIEATLSPDNSEFFYFVATSKSSRSHAFARTLEEHQANVKRYVKSGEPSP